MLDDFEKYMTVPDTWMPAEIKPYTPGVSLYCFFKEYIYDASALSHL